MRQFSLALVVVGVLGVANVSVAAASGWSLQRTPNLRGGGFLGDISCTSERACTAVGESGNSTLVERWNGSEWSIQPSPTPADARHIYLAGVSCASANACIAVGYYQSGSSQTGIRTLALAESWNGRSWTIQQTPQLPVPPGLPPGAGDSVTELTAVSCTSASSCTAVGDVMPGHYDVALIEHWNGTQWSLQQPASTRTPGLTFEAALGRISCTSASYCIAQGSHYSLKSGRSVAMTERWNGTQWSMQNTPIPTSTEYALLGRSNDGLGFPLFHHIPLPTGARSDVSGIAVFCNSKRACIGAGSWTPKGQLFSKALVERWNGSKWSIQQAPIPAGAIASPLEAVSCPSKSYCIAVGDYLKGARPRDRTLAERWTGG